MKKKRDDALLRNKRRKKEYTAVPVLAHPLQLPPTNAQMMQHGDPISQIFRVSMSKPTPQQLPFDIHCQNVEFNREEIKYLKSLPEATRAEITNKINGIQDDTSECPRRFRVLKSYLPNQNEIFKRLERCETPKYEQWVENALRIPFGKFSERMVDSENKNDLSRFAGQIRLTMDECIYGQKKTKDEVMRMTCQWLCGGANNQSLNLALHGLPGIGKTTFAKSVLAKTFNRPFQFISLGGISDAAYLTGHNYTYEGAIYGRIMEAVISSNVMDPIIYFDELDKISKTQKGDEIVNTLIHLTDASQNSHFRDKFFHGIDIDLSKVIFVFSFNNIRDVNPILLDRLNIVQMDAPDLASKVEIAKRHLIPRIVKSCNANDSVSFSSEMIEYIIDNFTDEAGVRNLERCITKIVTTLNVLDCSSEDPILPPTMAKKISKELINFVLSDQKTESSDIISRMYC